MARCRPWALSRRKKGGKSTTCPPKPTRGEQLAVTADDESKVDQCVDGVCNCPLSNCRDASLTIWPNCLCCRHSDAGRRE